MFWFCIGLLIGAFFGYYIGMGRGVRIGLKDSAAMHTVRESLSHD